MTIKLNAQILGLKGEQVMYYGEPLTLREMIVDSLNNPVSEINTSKKVSRNHWALAISESPDEIELNDEKCNQFADIIDERFLNPSHNAQSRFLLTGVQKPTMTIEELQAQYGDI